MDPNNIKSFLKLKVIWKDDEMFEVKITASNGQFSGSTKVYEQSEHLLLFASSLKDFPNDNKSLLYEIGQKNGYAYFSAKYYTVGRSSLIGIEMNFESNVATEFRPEEKNKLKLEIIVEPNAIDNFQKQLVQMGKTEEGLATLYGNDNRID